MQSLPSGWQGFLLYAAGFAAPELRSERDGPVARLGGGRGAAWRRLLGLAALYPYADLLAVLAQLPG